MITVKKSIIERIDGWTDDSIYILTDFDQTMTTVTSESSWSILSKSDIVAKGYVEESQELFNYYAPYEVNESLDYDIKNKLMSEWWSKHIELLVKYRVSEEVIDEAVNNEEVMSFREGVRDFLRSMKERNIPVIILSAGIGNFIEKFLIKNSCYYDNIFIISNFIRFEDGVAIGMVGNVIHSLNKGETSLPVEAIRLIDGRKNIILFGDLVADIKMAKEEDRENALKIGFLDEAVEENRLYFEEEFDVICTDNAGYNELFEEISNHASGV